MYKISIFKKKFKKSTLIRNRDIMAFGIIQSHFYDVEESNQLDIVAKLVMSLVRNFFID